MNLYTEIQYLLFSKENEKMSHSEKMEKMIDLIDKNNKERFNEGVKHGIIKSQNALEKLKIESLNP